MSLQGWKVKFKSKQVKIFLVRNPEAERAEDVDKEIPIPFDECYLVPGAFLAVVKPGIVARKVLDKVTGQLDKINAFQTVSVSRQTKDYVVVKRKKEVPYTDEYFLITGRDGAQSRVGISYPRDLKEKKLAKLREVMDTLASFFNAQYWQGVIPWGWMKVAEYTFYGDRRIKSVPVEFTPPTGAGWRGEYQLHFDLRTKEVTFEGMKKDAQSFSVNLTGLKDAAFVETQTAVMRRLKTPEGKKKVPLKSLVVTLADDAVLTLEPSARLVWEAYEQAAEFPGTSDSYLNLVWMIMELRHQQAASVTRQDVADFLVREISDTLAANDNAILLSQLAGVLDLTIGTLEPLVQEVLAGDSVEGMVSDEYLLLTSPVKPFVTALRERIEQMDHLDAPSVEDLLAQEIRLYRPSPADFQVPHLLPKRFFLLEEPAGEHFPGLGGRNEIQLEPGAMIFLKYNNKRWKDKVKEWYEPVILPYEHVSDVSFEEEYIKDDRGERVELRVRVKPKNSPGFFFRAFYNPLAELEDIRKRYHLVHGSLCRFFEEKWPVLVLPKLPVVVSGPAGALDGKFPCTLHRKTQAFTVAAKDPLTVSLVGAEVQFLELPDEKSPCLEMRLADGTRVLLKANRRVKWQAGALVKQKVKDPLKGRVKWLEDHVTPFFVAPYQGREGAEVAVPEVSLADPNCLD